MTCLLANGPAEIDAGLEAHTAGRFAEAMRHYERALEHEPDNCRALYLLGLAHASENRTAQARVLFEKCVVLQPGFSLAHNALGNAWLAAGDVRMADDAYRRAIACEEPCVEALCNLGSICRARGLVEEAIALYRRALVIKPCFAEAWCNLGVALKELNRLDDAASAFRQALAIRPDMAQAHFNEGLLHLLRGDFGGGWRKHEYRWGCEQRALRRRFERPLWLGDDPVDGRTILIHAEQGLGDTIQFLRYLPLLEGRGATVILEVQPALKGLVAEGLGARRVLARGEPLPDFDFHCPLLSLPLAFKTTLESIPGGVPYLRYPSSHGLRWQEILNGFPRPRVGFAWFGNRRHRNDLNRSIPARAAAQFLAGAPAPLHCLQVGISDPADAALAASPRMICLTDRIGDFSDTAALIGQLDLVISVDTSVAHLAGALGKPAWILLPFAPDWRWLLGRDDSPWYPSARLFRQGAPQDWDSLLRSVRDALECFRRDWTGGPGTA